MNTKARWQHPIDYKVHPRAGMVFFVWGIVQTVVVVMRAGETAGGATALDLVIGIGTIFFGAALRTQPGETRRWLVWAWLASVLGTLAVFAYVAIR